MRLVTQPNPTYTNLWQRQPPACKLKEIHGIYIDHGVDVTLEEVQEMVKAADKDGTGMLTEKEFVESGAQEVR